MCSLSHILHFCKLYFLFYRKRKETATWKVPRAALQNPSKSVKFFYIMYPSETLAIGALMCYNIFG